MWVAKQIERDHISTILLKITFEMSEREKQKSKWGQNH